MALNVGDAVLTVLADLTQADQALDQFGQNAASKLQPASDAADKVSQSAKSAGQSSKDAGDKAAESGGKFGALAKAQLELAATAAQAKIAQDNLSKAIATAATAGKDDAAAFDALAKAEREAVASGNAVGAAQKNYQAALKDAGAATKQLEIDSFTARSSIGLLGAQLGIQIPRQVEAFLAKIPAVHAALNVAFPILGAIGLLDIVYELGEAFDKELYEKPIKLKEAQEALFGSLQQNALDAEDQIRRVGAAIDGIRAGHLSELISQLQAIREEASKAPPIIRQTSDEFAKLGETEGPSKVEKALAAVGLTASYVLFPFFTRLHDNLAEQAAGWDNVSDRAREFSVRLQEVARNEGTQAALASLRAELVAVRQEAQKAPDAKEWQEYAKTLEGLMKDLTLQFELHNREVEQADAALRSALINSAKELAIARAQARKAETDARIDVERTTGEILIEMQREFAGRGTEAEVALNQAALRLQYDLNAKRLQAQLTEQEAELAALRGNLASRVAEIERTETDATKARQKTALAAKESAAQITQAQSKIVVTQQQLLDNSEKFELALQKNVTSVANDLFTISSKIIPGFAVETSKGLEVVTQSLKDLFPLAAINHVSDAFKQVQLGFGAMLDEEDKQRASIYAIGLAFDALGIKSRSALGANTDKAKTDVATLTKAYQEQKISLDELQQAQDRLRDAQQAQAEAAGHSYLFQQLGIESEQRQSEAIDVLINNYLRLQEARDADIAATGRSTISENDLAAAHRKVIQEQIQQIDVEIENRQSMGESTRDLERYKQQLENLIHATSQWDRTSGVTFKDLVKDWHSIITASSAAKNVIVDLYDAITTAATTALQQAILGEKSFGQAIREALAQELAAVAARDAVKAIEYTALGFASLAARDFEGAADYFKAAGIMGGVAVVAGVSARALAGDSFKPGGGGGTGEQVSATGGTPTQAQQPEREPVTTTNVQHFATGGVVTQPTRAEIGEGGEAEAILPLTQRVFRALAEQITALEPPRIEQPDTIKVQVEQPPPVQPTVEQPTVKPVIEQPPVIYPQVAPAIVSPQVQPANVVPVVGDATVRPVVEQPTITPQVNPAVVNPIVNNPLVNAIVRPLVESATVRPQVEQPTVRPVVENPAIRAFVENPTIRPLIEPLIRPNVETPTIRPDVEQPTISPRVNIPAITPLITQPTLSALRGPVAEAARVEASSHGLAGIDYDRLIGGFNDALAGVSMREGDVHINGRFTSNTDIKRFVREASKMVKSGAVRLESSNSLRTTRRA